MTERPDTEDYRHLFLNDVPLMDVRAPVEFEKGAFPNTLNLPLMVDEERRRVGIRYKEQGQQSAIELGHQLVRDDIKAQRVAAWVRFAKEHPDGYLYCFRGGLRSQISQQWLAEAGIQYPRVKGGYKALRRYLLDWFEATIGQLELIVVSGRTGTGKTRLIHDLPNTVDLEGIANHRGSSFGRTLTPQPAQIDFENRLIIDLLKAEHRGGPIYLEDESHLIGRCALPQALRDRMAQAPLWVLEVPLDERIDNILADYVTDMSAGFIARDGEDAGWHNFREYLLGSLLRIRKRLGGERHAELDAIMQEALEQQAQDGSLEMHRIWIEQLLRDYYDPMYDYQLSRKENPVGARGAYGVLLGEALPSQQAI